MSRVADTAAFVAEQLLGVEEGGRIPTTAELAARAGVGAGTVQAALKTLQDSGAVTLSTHGHLGTTLVARDVPGLWLACERGGVVGVVPLPQTLDFAGLATALTELFEDGGIPLHLTFRQGSMTRIEMVETGRADFIVLSAMAARSLDGTRFRIIELPPNTFYRQGSLVVITRSGENPEPGGRIAIDRYSYDHTLLTNAEFPSGNYVDARYIRIPEMVTSGEVDAAVWHDSSSSPLSTATDLALHALQRPMPVDESVLSAAAFVSRANEAGVHAALAAVLDVDRLIKVQRAVVAGERIPSF